MSGVEEWPTAVVVDGRRQELPDPVAVEEPLELRLVRAGASTPLAVTMRTPGHDRELAAGFLYAEGLADAPADFVAIRAADAGGRENAAEIELRAELDLAARAQTRSFLSTAACGVCGKTAIESIFAKGVPLTEPGHPRIARAVLESLPARMREAQRNFARTGGLHAAALFDAHGALVVLREDVGRHNAVDKVVGERLLAGAVPLRDGVLVLSGRAGFEIVQKAARAGIPVVAAIGAPSSLALRTAERSGMTLVGFLRRGRFNLYTAPERIAL
ncbi:MAG: formate dehydrogenase accessory sulfurtransferase FdhD [Proteobacteria bacterium]|nr:MAG: formate dehydrogenase accessory sulfurtransferase FdhD [Pseudomonadota bacterium]